MNDIEVPVGTFEFHIVEHQSDHALQRRLYLDHIRVLRAQLTTRGHGIDNVDTRLASQLGSLVEAVAEKQCHNEIALSHIVALESRLHLGGGVPANIGHIQLHADSLLGKFVERQQQSFVEFDKLKLAVALLAPLFDVEFRCANHVELIQVQRHHQTHLQRLAHLPLELFRCLAGGFGGRQA